jgi:hypothetical protein
MGVWLRKQGYMTRDGLRAVIMEQLERVLQAVVAWDAGTFAFEVGKAPPAEDQGFDLSDLRQELGLGVAATLLHSLKTLDEAGASPASTDGVSPRTAGGGAASLGRLGTSMRILSRCEHGTELLQKFVESLHVFAARTLVLIPAGETLQVIGGHGSLEDGRSVQERAGTFLDLESDDARLLRASLERREPYVGVGDELPSHVSGVLGTVAGEWWTVPRTAGDRLRAVIYADAGHDGAGSLFGPDLVALAMHASLLLEREHFRWGQGSGS